MPKKRRKSDTIPALTKKLDRVFSRWVRLKYQQEDGGVPCITCAHVGTVKTMQAGHWIPRQHAATRWEEWNVRPQCFACNMYYGGRPQEYREQLEAIYGTEAVDEMARRRHSVKHWTREELKEKIEHYKTAITLT